MKAKILCCAAAFVTATCLACSGVTASVPGVGSASADRAFAATSSKAKPAKPSKKQLKAFKKASAKFSLKLFQSSVKRNGKNNTVVAPMSVMTMLALAGNGSAGKTRTELQDLLAGGAKIKQLDKNMRWFNAHLVNSKNAKLESANAIWYRDDGTIKLKSAFKKANQTYFDALVEAKDFSDSATVDYMNDWMSDKTNGMIPKAIDTLDDSTKTVLANTLYFNAKWLDPYVPEATVKKGFTNASGSKHKVDMMDGSENTYISGAKVKGLKGTKGFVKPYVKGYSFVALLPKKGTSLKSFTKKLTGAAFTKLVKGATSTRVITTMPKLDVEYSDEDMCKTLQKIGLKRATDPFKADFSKMGSSVDGGLYLDQVIHKTRLKLDEDGTEAAAVTVGMDKCGSAPFRQVKPKVVRLNRPFVFAIVDNSTSLPLFIGAINDVK